MSTPFVLAVPSKGRLQENAEAFFTRAGLSLAKPRGARDYRGTIAGLDNVEIAYLSASEIAAQLARGMVHLGVTGEDLLRESIADADKRVLLIDSLGFGSANVAARELVFLEVGAEAEVLYNPQNPREAALIVDKPTWRYLFIFLFGALLAWLSWQLRKLKPRPAPQMQPQTQPQMQPQPQLQMQPHVQVAPQAPAGGQLVPPTKIAP